jgi:MreB/Mbl protein
MEHHCLTGFCRTRRQRHRFKEHCGSWFLCVLSGQREITLQNLRPLASLFSEDLAIDLGTVNTQIYARDRGIVVNEPSAVALEDGEVNTMDKETQEMLGHTPAKIAFNQTVKSGGDH